MNMNRKYRRPLRRSLILSTLAMVLLLSVIAGIAGFFVYRDDMIRRYQNYAGDAIDFLARCIDGDDLEQCIKTGKKSEKYEELQLLANDFKETHDLVFIYIIKPLRPDPPDNMMDVLAAWTSWGKADGTDGLTDLGVLTGDAYPKEVAEEYLARMDRNAEVTYFRNDTDFGRIYTAIRPIFNSDGDPIAVICGDIMIDEINDAIVNYLMISLGIAIIVGILMALIMNRWFTVRLVGPISRLEYCAGLFEKKCSARADVSELVMENPDIHTGDEIEALSDAISDMVSDVRDYAKDLVSKDDEISSMKEYVDKMDVLAYRDSLTGGGNKAAYEKAKIRLDWNILSECAEFAIVMCDLNYLKRINDTYGHDKGNIYIQKLYGMLVDSFKESPVFRIGGDEFIVLVENDELAHCEELIEKLKGEINERFTDTSLEPWERVSSAIGYARFSKEVDSDTDAVFRRADEDMYAQKKLMHADRRV